VLTADGPAGMVDNAMEHGAHVHGFTPAWYGQARRDAMTATVTRHDRTR